MAVQGWQGLGVVRIKEWCGYMVVRGQGGQKGGSYNVILALCLN